MQFYHCQFWPSQQHHDLPELKGSSEKETYKCTEEKEMYKYDAGRENFNEYCNANYKTMESKLILQMCNSTDL